MSLAILGITFIMRNDTIRSIYPGVVGTRRFPDKEASFDQARLREAARLALSSNGLVGRATVDISHPEQDLASDKVKVIFRGDPILTNFRGVQEAIPTECQ